MNEYGKSLIRRCEVFDATAATAVAIQGRWWLGRTSLDCLGRLRLPRNDESCWVQVRSFRRKLGSRNDVACQPTSV